MVNVGVRSEELSGKLPANLDPICRDLSSRCFSIWSRPLIVVEWRRHSYQNIGRINLRRDEARVFRSAVRERAVDEMALAEFRVAEIAAREGRALERDMAEESSPKKAALEGAVVRQNPTRPKPLCNQRDSQARK